MSTFVEKFVVGTYNLNAKATRTKKDLVLADLVNLLSLCDVICLQEAGDAKDIIEQACALTGAGVYRGEGRFGQGATPILYRSGIVPNKTQSVALTPTTNVGNAGAGPNSQKAKWLNMIRLTVNGRIVWVGSIHTTPSIYIPARRRLANRQFTNAAKAFFDLQGLHFLAGDMNSKPNQSIRNPLKAAKLISSQVTLGTINTFSGRTGTRPIDDVEFTEDSVRLGAVNHYVVPGVSDHDAYVVEFNIVPRQEEVVTHLCPTDDHPCPLA